MFAEWTPILENAERLVTDAEMLLEAGRYPSAASLAVLALEECGKYQMMRTGSPDPGTLRSHRAKQRAFAPFAVSNFVIDALRADGWPMDGPGMAAFEAAVEERGDEALRAVVTDALARAHGEAEAGLVKMIESGELDRLKMQGFYVDVEGRTEVKAPSVEPSDAVRLVRVAREFVEYLLKKAPRHTFEDLQARYPMFMTRNDFIETRDASRSVREYSESGDAPSPWCLREQAVIVLGVEHFASNAWAVVDEITDIVLGTWPQPDDVAEARALRVVGRWDETVGTIGYLPAEITRALFDSGFGTLMLTPVTVVLPPREGGDPPEFTVKIWTHPDATPPPKDDQAPAA